MLGIVSLGSLIILHTMVQNLGASYNYGIAFRSSKFRCVQAVFPKPNQSYG